MTREEAIRRIKSWNLDSDDMEVLSSVIPELAESEDERIRKALISLVDENAYTYKSFAGVDLYSMLAWLEKQKDSPMPEDTVVFQKGVAEGRRLEREDMEKVRKPSTDLLEFSDAYREGYNEEDLQTRFAFYTYKDEPRVLYLSNLFVEEASRNRGLGTKILKAAEKVAETMGASSIGLKVKQDSPANAWYRKNGYGYLASEDGYDWLEKTLKNI